MTSIPHERMPDSTLALLRDPYRWIARRATSHGRPLFEARIMGEPTILVTGPSAAAMFSAPGRFTRQGALPKPILWLLQDEGSVTTKDGAPHAVRKAMFLALMTPARLAAADALFGEEWDRAIDRWATQEQVELDAAAKEVVCRAVCRWAGVPLEPGEAETRARDLAALFDGAGAVGRRRVRAWAARRRTEAWIRALTAQVRAGRVRLDPESAFAAMAEHRDVDGRPLSDETLTVELINLLRPTVAVGRYITFAALALHANSGERRFLEHATVQPSVDPAAQDPGAAVDDRRDPVWRFVQEVRRTAPFFPLVGGRVVEPFTWEGHTFERGRRVLLDLHGTNRDPTVWDDPADFLPERFLGWAGDPYRLIPQGAGDPATDHRCPGEWLTIALMKTAVRSLTKTMDYAVASQDLRLPYRRIPTRPNTGLVIRRVRRRA